MKKRLWSMVFILGIAVMAVVSVVAGEEEQAALIITGESYEQLPNVTYSNNQELEGMQEQKNWEEGNLSLDSENELCRVVRIKGENYYDTGVKSESLRCGVMDGEITSEVAIDEMPVMDNQSNFGKGYGYQYWGNKVVHVNIEGEWCIFQASEAYRLTVTDGSNGEMVELERGPQFWSIVEKYHGIDANKAENQMERVGYAYCLRLYDKEDNLMNTVTPLGNEVKIDNIYYKDNGYGNVAELFLVLDTLFGENIPVATATEKVTEAIDALEAVSMHVSYATDKGANIIFYNYSDKELQFGSDYELQMLKNEEWYTVDYIIDNWAFNCIAYMMPKDKPISWNIKWTYFHGILPPGQYRIVKDVMDFTGTGDDKKYRLAAEFDVK